MANAVTPSGLSMSGLGSSTDASLISYSPGTLNHLPNNSKRVLVGSITSTNSMGFVMRIVSVTAGTVANPAAFST